MGNNFFELRVLEEFNDTYMVFVAQCLQTGSMVTADDQATLRTMMTELLEDELSYAFAHKNLSNLFSKPAPDDVWLKWYEAAKTTEPEIVMLTIRSAGSPLHMIESEVPSELQVATAA